MRGTSTSLPCLVLAGLCLFTAGCSRSPMARARDFLDAGMAADAVPLLQLEIQAKPKNAGAHLLLGEAELQLGDPRAARESFDRALRLDSRLAERVGAAYADAAERMSGSNPQAGPYLEAARSYTHALDRRLARIYRRFAQSTLFPEGPAEAALRLDPTLARDDTLAYLLAARAGIAEMEEFLATFPRSGYRLPMLTSLARAALTSRDYGKARAAARQVGALEHDPDGRAQLAKLTAQIDAEETAAAAVQAEERRSEAATAEAQERSRQAQLKAQVRAAAADAMLQAREAENRARIAEAQAAERERQTQERLRRQAELRPILALLPGHWRFQNCAAAGLPEGYLDFQRVEPDGRVTGEFVFPTWYQPRTKFTGTVNGTIVELIRDVGSPERWAATIDVSARTLTGTRDGGEFKDRSARKE